MSAFVVSDRMHLSLLGAPASDARVQELIELGSGKPPKVKRGDDTAWVQLESLGIELVFTRDLCLNNITFYGEGDDTYSAFAGELPRGITLASTRAELATMLGAPEWSSAGKVPMDRWRLDDVWYFARFTPDESRLEQLSIQVPD